jgi:hypothetical protein
MAFALAASVTAFPVTSPAEELDLCVMTYNVRVPLDKTPYTWPECRMASVDSCTNNGSSPLTR